LIKKVIAEMSRSLDVILFCAYTVASVAGLVIIKTWLAPAQVSWQTASFLGTPALIVAIGSVLYIASFLIWLVILGRNDLSVAYPIAIGLTLVFSTLAASIVIGEVVSPLRYLGVLVIFFGIWLVSRT
jgi:drug/metabolite transporter (DMT)-like permease